MAGADVLTVGMAADEVRRQTARGHIVTYTRVHTLDAQALSRNDVQVPDAASELRLYAAPESLEHAVAHVRRLREAAGTRRVTAFSLADLLNQEWAQRDGALQSLVEAGWNDVAELPADRLTDLAGAVELLRNAGLEPRRITVSHPFGGARDEIIERVQRAFKQHACLRRFSPLPRVAPIDKPTTGYDDVRMVALSRLAMPGRSIEVDWSLYGPKLAQVALTFGADHLDAVPAADDAALGRRRATVEDVERNIRAAGFEPEELR